MVNMVILIVITAFLAQASAEPNTLTSTTCIQGVCPSSGDPHYEEADVASCPLALSTRATDPCLHPETGPFQDHLTLVLSSADNGFTIEVNPDVIIPVFEHVTNATCIVSRVLGYLTLIPRACINGTLKAHYAPAAISINKFSDIQTHRSDLVEIVGLTVVDFSTGSLFPLVRLTIPHSNFYRRHTDSIWTGSSVGILLLMIIICGITGGGYFFRRSQLKHDGTFRASLPWGGYHRFNNSFLPSGSRLAMIEGRAKRIGGMRGTLRLSYAAKSRFSSEVTTNAFDCEVAYMGPDTNDFNDWRPAEIMKCTFMGSWKSPLDETSTPFNYQQDEDEV